MKVRITVTGDYANKQSLPWEGELEDSPMEVWVPKGDLISNNPELFDNAPSLCEGLRGLASTALMKSGLVLISASGLIHYTVEKLENNKPITLTIMV